MISKRGVGGGSRFGGFGTASSAGDICIFVQHHAKQNFNMRKLDNGSYFKQDHKFKGTDYIVCINLCTVAAAI